MTVVATRPVLAACHRVTVVHGRGSGLVTALAEAEFAVHEGERVALLRRLGLGQDDAAARARRLDRPVGGRGDLARGAVVDARRVQPGPGPRARDRLRFSGRQPAADLHRLRERRLRRTRGGPSGLVRRRRPRQGRRPRAGRAARRSSGSRPSSMRFPASCRAGRRSAWRSPARSRSARRCCCATSRPATSTPTPARACST